MKILNDMMKDVIELSKADPDLLILFGSSMGQKAIHRDEHHGHELSVTDLKKLVEVLKINGFSFEPLIAMVPQVALQVQDVRMVTDFAAKIATCKYHSGAPVFQCNVVDRSISLTIKTPRLEDVQAGVLYCGTDKVDFSTAGIAIHKVDPGTAYHTPEGVLAFYNPALKTQPQNLFRFRLSADQVKKMLLDMSNCSIQNMEDKILNIQYLESRARPAEVNI